MADKDHIERLKAGAESWNEWRAANKDVQPDLIRADLDRLDLSDFDLSDCNLNKASMRSANLARANLSGSNLSEANLEKAYLSASNLDKANLSRANLTKANLFGASLNRASLQGADLYETMLHNAQLRHVDLTGSKLTNANLSEANLSSADLSRAYLSRVNFQASILRKANLKKANLFEADLSQADLFDANLDGAVLALAKLTSSNLEGADLANTVLTGADLSNTTLNRVRLTHCNFSEAIVSGVQVIHSIIEDVKQKDLIVWKEDGLTLAVDGLDFAQRIYKELTGQAQQAVREPLLIILGEARQKQLTFLSAIRNAARDNARIPMLFSTANWDNPWLKEALLSLIRPGDAIVADLVNDKHLIDLVNQIAAARPDTALLPLSALDSYEDEVADSINGGGIRPLILYDDPQDLHAELTAEIAALAVPEAELSVVDESATDLAEETEQVDSPEPSIASGNGAPPIPEAVAIDAELQEEDSAAKPDEPLDEDGLEAAKVIDETPSESEADDQIETTASSPDELTQDEPDSSVEAARAEEVEDLTPPAEAEPLPIEDAPAEAFPPVVDEDEQQPEAATSKDEPEPEPVSELEASAELTDAELVVQESSPDGFPPVVDEAIVEADAATVVADNNSADEHDSPSPEPVTEQDRPFDLLPEDLPSGKVEADQPTAADTEILNAADAAVMQASPEPYPESAPVVVIEDPEAEASADQQGKKPGGLSWLISFLIIALVFAGGYWLWQNLRVDLTVNIPGSERVYLFVDGQRYYGTDSGDGQTFKMNGLLFGSRKIQVYGAQLDDIRDDEFVRYRRHNAQLRLEFGEGAAEHTVRLDELYSVRKIARGVLPNISSDGSRMTYIDERGEPGSRDKKLMLKDLDSGAVDEISVRDRRFYRAEWQRPVLVDQARYIYLSGNERGRTIFYQVETANGRLRRLPIQMDKEVAHFAVLPDQQGLLIGNTLHSLDGASTSTLFEDQPLNRMISLAGDTGLGYLVRRGSIRRSLGYIGKYYDLNTGESRELLNLLTRKIPYLQVGANGESALVTQYSGLNMEFVSSVQLWQDQQRWVALSKNLRDGTRKIGDRSFFHKTEAVADAQMRRVIYEYDGDIYLIQIADGIAFDDLLQAQLQL